MKIVARLAKLFGRKHNAERIEKIADAGQHNDGGGVHRFAPQREQAVLDCRRVGLLASALQAQRGRVADCSASDKIRELRVVAEQCGLWLDRDRIETLGDLVSKRTGESEVYWNRSEGVFYKVKSLEAKRPIKRTGDDDWIYEHVIHNILFPECHYDFVGISELLGDIRVVLKQQAICTEQFPTEEQVEEDLLRRGLYKEDRYFYGDGVVSVTDVGAHGDNVLLGDDGKVYFIDPLIRLKRPANEVIEYLTGYNPLAGPMEDSRA